LELKYVLGELNNMAEKSISKKSDIIWNGKPWILPAVIIRGIAAIVVALFLTWLVDVFKVASVLCWR
jgi:hypothetical protein